MKTIELTHVTDISGKKIILNIEDDEVSKLRLIRRIAYKTGKRTSKIIFKIELAHKLGQTTLIENL